MVLFLQKNSVASHFFAVYPWTRRHHDDDMLRKLFEDCSETCSEDRRPTLKHFWLCALFPGRWPSCSSAQRRPITHCTHTCSSVYVFLIFILFIPWFGRKLYLDLVMINIFAMMNLKQQYLYSFSKDCAYLSCKCASLRYSRVKKPMGVCTVWLLSGFEWEHGNQSKCH